MNLKNMITRSEPTNTLAPPTARQRVTALLSINRSTLAIYEQEFQAGERSAAEVQHQRDKIAKLEHELQSLDTYEAAQRRLSEDIRVALPKAEAQLEADGQDFVDDLQDLCAKARAIRDQHAAILERFGDPKYPGANIVRGLRNRDLLTLFGSGRNTSMIAILTDPDGSVARFLKMRGKKLACVCRTHSSRNESRRQFAGTRLRRISLSMAGT